MEQDFLIVGGGIAGLATGLALQSIGKHVTIIEQGQTDEAQQEGAGIQIGPNAVRALRRLGLWDAMAEQCFAPIEIHIRDGRSAKLLQRIRLGQYFKSRFGEAYQVAHRADLLALLRSNVAMQQIMLHDHHRACAIRQTQNLVEVEASHTTISGALEEKIFTSQVALLADGVFSQLRSTVAPGIVPIFRKMQLFRALVPAGDLRSVADADLVTLWLCPGGHLVHYGIRGGALMNLVAVCAREESPEKDRHNVPSQEVAAFFGSCAPLMQDLLGKIPNWTRWPAYDLPEFSNWCKGSVALIGDAAHASLPFLAQGAAMALEDACVLSHSLTGAIALTDGLQNYAKRRQARTHHLQRRSRQMTPVYHAQGLMASMRNGVLSGLGERSVLGGLDWIYRYVP